MNLQTIAKLGNRLAYQASEGNEAEALATAKAIAAECGIVAQTRKVIAPQEGPPVWFTLPPGALSHDAQTGKLKPNPMLYQHARDYKPGTRPNWFDAVAPIYNELYGRGLIADCIDPAEIDGQWMRPDWSPVQWVQIANSVLELAPLVGYSDAQIAAARKRIG